MKLLVLNNISAGLGDGGIYDFIRSFAGPDDEITMRIISRDTQLEQLLGDASRFDAVVAAGGDGTISSVCYHLRYSGIPVLVFPSGTANLIALNIAHPSEPVALAKLCRSPQIADFDLGEFDFGDAKRGFMMMAGCGFDANIMSSAQKDKQLLGELAYFKAVFENTNPQVASIDLEIDGEQVHTRGVGIVVMNFSHLQFDVSLSMDAVPNDGILDVCVLATQSAWDLLPSAIGAALDKSGKVLEQSDVLQFYRGKEIRVATDPPLSVEYDGEATDLTTPFTARVHHHAAKLIVSPECIDALI